MQQWVNRIAMGIGIGIGIGNGYWYTQHRFIIRLGNCSSQLDS